MAGQTSVQATESTVSSEEAKTKATKSFVGDVNSVHQLGKNCLSGLKYIVKSLRVW